MAKIGDAINFKRIRWVLVEKEVSPCGVVYFKYRSLRNYYRFFYPKFTEETYTISPERWEYLRERLEENKDTHYTQCGWG